MGFTEFLDTYLAHIIAVVALVQVWVIAAYKKWILKGKIEFHPSANMEIGFSGFGSTVSLPGALRASEKDAFVTQMRLTIIRESDRAQHNFSWRAFKILDPAFVDALFQEFVRESVPVDFHTRLNHGFFWHAGNYFIELEVTCADVPQRVYRWRASLSEKEEQRLRLNTVAIMKELCSIKVQYDFVYKPYHAAT